MIPPSQSVNAPKISIVITCFNYEIYVGPAIESALNQVRAADEIIVVDDGSTDSSAQTIARYGEKVRSVYQQNRGNIAAFERGYAESSGDLIIFLDADDILFPQTVDSVASAWQDDVSKIQYDLEVIDGSGAFIGRYFCAFPKSYTTAQLYSEFERTGTYIWPVMSGNAYSRTFLRQVMPMMPPVGYDGALNTIAPLYGKVVTLAKPLGQYRLHGRNISRHDNHGRAQRYPDFSRQIGFRTKEFEILKAHCQQKHFHLPDTNFLDNEIVFVNYRLAARKLGQQYIGQDSDTSFRLWLRGVTLALNGSNSLRMTMHHLLWFTALFLSPGWLSHGLILMRFNRAELLKPLQDLKVRIWNRLTSVYRSIINS
jgi:glycosyltransferase involved in cell wall biosynthesis